MKEWIEQFELAFDSHVSGCRRTCECGREYWDDYNSGYSWEDGEVESLEKDSNAIAVGHSVGTVIFEGREYCMDCNCWHARAKQIMQFIHGHAPQIARLLKLEKARLQELADRAPTVE